MPIDRETLLRDAWDSHNDPDAAIQDILALADVICAIAVRWDQSFHDVVVMMSARYDLIASLKHPVKAG